MQQEAITHWVHGSDDALETAQQLFQAGKYHHALFFLHLRLEKLLKALIVKKTDVSPLPIHDLLHLTKIADLPITEDEISWLGELSTFNVAARYDDEKFQFYKKATREYATTWFERGKRFLESWRSLV